MSDVAIFLVKVFFNYFLLMGWPSVSVTVLNAAISCLVIGPGLPVPIVRPSTHVIGATSAAVPVQIISSAE
jgi:hypothetical protein